MKAPGNTQAWSAQSAFRGIFTYAVRVEAHDRKRLEQLCRYITRPALSDERVQLNAAGQVELKLKTPWRDGTTHLVMSPLEFMQRLAALVPRPRLHLIRYHGVLAPNARLRPLVVPQKPEVQERAAEVAVAGGCDVQTVQSRPHRVSWARLLKRVFDIDVERCPNCGAGELKIIAAILERPVIEKILSHLGLDPQPPPKGRAREAGLHFVALAACAVGYLSLRAAGPLPPGWRCALCRQAMANIRVNPEAGPNLRAVKVQGPANSPAPSLQRPGLRAESAQTCALRPIADPAGSLFRPSLGASCGV